MRRAAVGPHRNPLVSAPYRLGSLPMTSLRQQDATILSHLVERREAEILAAWLDILRREADPAAVQLADAELEGRCRTLLRHLREGLAAGGSRGGDEAFIATRNQLAEISRSRAVQGFSSAETALLVLSLKEPLFRAAEAESAGDAGKLAGTVRAANQLVDRLALHTMEVFQRSREEVIVRQQREIAELSTPVVRLWRGVLALPLIGTLDSERTQVVMENLLQSIVDEHAEVAIIDITGVPTVDTLVAQHLLKTVAAARLMGAECMVSGIRPQIAQTMVHLGVELDVVTKASLADAFAMALRRVGLAVGPARSAAQPRA
jgi:rsbT co-antagonist protein RsbR